MGAEGESISWTVKGDDGSSDTGTGSRVRVSCSKPGFVCVEARTSPSGLGYTASVGFGVADIQPDSTRPEDLKGFWDNRLKAIQDAIDPSKVEMEYVADANSCHIYKVKIDDLPDGLGPCVGWLSVPTGADSGTKYRADGFFFGYDNSWAADNWARPSSPPRDYIQFRVMAHPCELGQNQAYYDECKTKAMSNGKTHGLDPVQNANPLTSYFNGMACRDIRAMLFLKTLEAWNGTELTTTGHSQGGLQSIWAGLAPGVTQINPECPWNCNMYGPSKAGRVTGGRLVEQWVAGLDYYDPCFVGRLISLDCEVNLTRAGLADYTCPPSGVAAFYNTLPQKKSIKWLQGSAHSQSSIPAVQHWFNGEEAKDATFSIAANYADTKEYVPVLPEEEESDDGYCGDISEYTDLTNRFVSKGGTWGANDQKYTKIQDAVTAAKAGDVIWIHDGFVCKPASDADYVGGDSGNSTKAHFKIEKNITLRSVSGDARNHPNPPRLQGLYHDEEGAKTNPCDATWRGPESGGTKAIRALAATKGTYKGLVFEHSAHGGWHPSYAECAIYGSGYAVDKCIFRDCHGTSSMLNANITMTDCVVSNNTKAAIAGGSKLIVRGTLFKGNTGGAISHSSDKDVGSIVTNCVFDGNTASNGGAIYSKSGILVVDCLFTNNVASQRGGAFAGRGVLSNCIFRCNTTYKTGSSYSGEGGAVSGDAAAGCILYDCIVQSNGIYKINGVASGGGVDKVTAYRTLIADNYALANGGGAGNSILYDCQVVRNDAINTDSTSGGRGGGVYGGSATRCVIANNTAQPLYNTANCGRGGGAYDASLYNCIVSNNYSRSAYGNRGGSVCLATAGREVVNTLVVGNRAPENGSAGIVDETSGGCAVKNCTVTGNTSKSGNRGCVTVAAVNTIVWNNSGSTASTYVSAQNSCLDVDVTDTETYPDCISEDPKFANNGFSDYELDKDSPCVDTALTQQWMLEVGSPLSKALNGNDRVIGVKPDMGCFELYKKDVPTTCTVTFDLGEHGVRTGGGELIQLVAYETAAIAPTVEPNHCLWTFVGWDEDFSCVTEDMTVTAQYEAVDPETVTHTVTFDIGTHGERTGGGELEQTVTHFHAADEPEFTQHEGWVFQNWDKDFSSVESDLAVKAVWKRVEILPVEGAGEEGAPIKVETLTDPVNRFVSSTGDWGGNNQRYTDLESAMKASNTGDVIWMRNGYVERPADAKDYVTLGDSAGLQRVHFAFTKKVTVRGLYGDARTDPNPPRLWGRWSNPDSDPVVRKGEGAIRQLRIDAGATFEGLVFENGAAYESASYPDGIRGDGAATFSKCVFRNNYFYANVLGGKNFKVVDCVISNNACGGVYYAKEVRNTLVADNQGKGIANDSSTAVMFVSNCVVRGGFTSSWGAGVYNKTLGNMAICDSVVSNNFAYQRGAGFVGQGVISNCVFAGNHTNRSLGNSFEGEGAAICGDSTNTCFVYDSIITNNWSEKAGKAQGAGAYKATVVRSLIADNVATGDGGGAYNCDLTDCVIRGNESKNISSNVGGHGGGIAYGRATRCVIAGNKVVERTHPTPCDGGGAYNASLYNCTIVSNLSNSIYGYGGGAVCFTGSGYRMVNCLVADNESLNTGVGGVANGDLFSGSVVVGCATNEIVNCTVVGNTSKSGIGGVRKAVFVNSISWGNGGKADTFLAATNSCAAGLADAEKYPGCITDDPRFNADGSWTLRLRSPCKDTAMPFGWMTDAADPRSKDLAGNDRWIGVKPDMGCYERPPKIGFTIFVR